MLKKIILIFLGLIGSLIILEISMQTAGFVISSYQNHKNNKALKNKSQYTIMCLGESTTFGEYTKYLQQVLNKKYPNKFSVIDCGVPGIHLGNMLRMLDLNIAKYKPDIAVCMMGINDGFVSFYDDSKYIENNRYEYFKLYKMYKLMKKHLKFSLKTKEVYADNVDSYTMKYAYELYVQKKYSDAEFIAKNIIKIDPNSYELYDFLAMLYYYHLNKKDLAYEIALDIIEKNKNIPTVIKQNMYEIAIAYNLNIKKNIEFAKQLAGQLTNMDDVVITVNLYWFIKDIMSPEQKTKFLKKISSSKETIDQYYGIIAIESMNEKDFKKAEEYFAKAEEMRLKYPKESTYNLYKYIVNKLIENNIKVLCMQYPVRSIESLKNNLKDEHCYNKIEFVSNENNFKDLLKNKKFNEVFNDQFAGDFGHYKEEGSILIAENVIGSLEKILN